MQPQDNNLSEPASLPSLENVVSALIAEMEYWSKSTALQPYDAITIGALSNVLAYATVPGWKAPWHPAKSGSQPAGFACVTHGPQQYALHLPMVNTNGEAEPALRLCATCVLERLAGRPDTAQPAQATPEPTPRTDQEIVDQTNQLAALLALVAGYQVPDGHRFDGFSAGARDRLYWHMACVAQDLLTQTDANDALKNLHG